MKFIEYLAKRDTNIFQSIKITDITIRSHYNESVINDENLKNALINYQLNPNDNNAKNEFYSNVVKFVHIWCRKRNCDNRGMTKEDLTSDVYTKLTNKIDELDNGKEFLNSLIPDQFARYLSTMIRNLRIDAIRKNIRLKKKSGISLDAPVGKTEELSTVADNVPSKESLPEEEGMRNEKIDIVRMAIRNLRSPVDREIADLFYTQDMKYTDIAEKLNIPLGTVKSRISGFRGKIKDALIKLGISE